MRWRGRIRMEARRNAWGNKSRRWRAASKIYSLSVELVEPRSDQNAEAWEGTRFINFPHKRTPHLCGPPALNPSLRERQSVTPHRGRTATLPRIGSPAQGGGMAWIGKDG